MTVRVPAELHDADRRCPPTPVARVVTGPSMRVLAIVAGLTAFGLGLFVLGILEVARMIQAVLS